MTEKLFIGIDGGGSKTEALLVRESGEVLAHLWRNESAMFPIVGTEQACKILFEIFADLCSASSSLFIHVERVAICLAGAGRKEDQLAIKKELEAFAREKNISHPEIVIESDAVAALSAAFGAKGEGCIAIAGTGSVALARTSSGEIFRAGGWGRTMGDEGSGHWLGTKALMCYAKSLDGRRRDVPKEFIDSVDARLKTFQSAEKQSLVSKIYSLEIIPAAFAPDLIRAAENSHRFAIEILEQGAEELFIAINAVTEKAGLVFPAPVALFGGLMGENAPPMYRSFLAAKLLSSKKFSLVLTPPAAVFGAIIIAKNSTGHVVASGQDW